MANRDILCVVLTILLLGNIAVTSMSIIHALKAQKVVKLSDQSAQIVEQLRDDWKVVPFTSIRLVSGDEPCPGGTEPVFKRLWPGTVEGCIYEDKIWTKVAFDNNQKKVPKKEKQACNFIEALEPVEQIKFYGSTVCGRRNGLNYLEANRVDQTTLQCPEGMAPCSSQTSSENTICYSPEDHPLKCPITEIKFVTPEEAELLDENIYTVLKDDDHQFDERYLAYSKTTDAKPVIQTRVEFKPCLDPTKTSQSPTQVFYMLEIAKDDYCEKEDENDDLTLKYDSRYYDTSLRIREFDIQEPSRVYEELSDLPLYEKQLPFAQEAKENVRFGFYTRQTLSWSLDCEKDLTRQQLHDVFLDVESLDTTSFLFIQFATMLLAALSLLCCCCKCFCSCIVNAGGSCKQICCPVCVFWSAVCLQAALIAGVIYFSFESMATNDRRIVSMKSLKYVNECADEFTRLPIISIDKDLEDAQLRFEDLNIYAYAIAGTVLLMVLVAFIGLCLAFSIKERKRIPRD